MIHKIYGVGASTQKSKLYQIFDHFFPFPSTETIIDKKRHAVKRRALYQALYGRGAADMETSFLTNVERLEAFLAKQLRTKQVSGGENWSEPFDFANLMSYLTFDAMGDICFGHSFNTLQKPDNRYLMGIISDGTQALNTVS